VRASDPTGQQPEGAFGIDYTRNFKVPELLEAGDAQCTAWAERFLEKRPRVSAFVFGHSD